MDQLLANSPGLGRPASGSAIEVRGLRMRYGTKDVLRGIDLTVGLGEVVVIVGPNGAGKTTTIEILEGFRRRSSGDVSVLGQDPWHADDAWRAEVGIVLQSWRDHARWRVRDLLAHLGAYAPRVLRRMASRESGTSVAGARERALQRG